jgi:hypothetical protein
MATWPFSLNLPVLSEQIVQVSQQSGANLKYMPAFNVNYVKLPLT